MTETDYSDLKDSLKGFRNKGPTGAERYLTKRLEDPEYRQAWETAMDADAESQVIIEVTDVTQSIIDSAVQIADGFYGDGPIDWESLIERLEEWEGIEFPEYDTPAERKIKREVRKIRRQG